MSLSDAIYNACGHSLNKMKPISGGDICEAYCATLSNGSKIFIKVHDSAQMLHAEAIGLDWLSSAGAETPTVLAASKETALKGFLALSWVDVVHPNMAHWVNLGISLAQVHSFEEKQCGWVQDNSLGVLHQDNRPMSNWADFYRDRRLIPQMKMAIDTKKASVNLSKKLDPILRRLNDVLPAPDRISRLHGDLWSGNVLFGAKGATYLIDPAPYCGHREMDFAMMELFGGFHPRAYAAYDERLPLQDQWRDRMGYYQLYYLLAHVNLHGSSWMGQVYSTLDRLL